MHNIIKHGIHSFDNGMKLAETSIHKCDEKINKKKYRPISENVLCKTKWVISLKRF